MLAKLAFVITAIVILNPIRSLAAEITCLEYWQPSPEMAFSIAYPSGRQPTSASCQRIFLQGEIVSGDEQKFSTFLKAHHPFVSELYLSSPGGSVRDALAIGKLVREAMLETHAPVTGSRPGRGVLDDLGFGRPGQVGRRFFCKGSRCHCASACFLIWAGGWERWGDAVGIHRPTAGTLGFGNLPPDRASAAYRQIIDAIANYLSEMEIPRRYIEQMTSTPSETMLWLSTEDASQLEHVPSIQEWLQAKCRGGDKTCKSRAIYNARDSKHL